MNHQDAYVSDITVVAEDLNRDDMIAVVEKLKTSGMEVDEVDHVKGVIEGTILADKVESLRKIDHVKYIRIELTYIADYPTGDPRDLDGPETA